MTTSNFGYGMVDRYRMTAFEIFKNLIAAQRVSDDAEVSESDAETLVDESIKYAYYFTKYANIDEKYSDNLPAALIDGTSEVAGVNIDTTSDENGNVYITPYKSIEAASDTNKIFKVEEDSSVIIHVLPKYGYMVNIAAIGTDLSFGESDLDVVINNDNRSIGAAITIPDVSAGGYFSVSHVYIPEEYSTAQEAWNALGE